MTVEVVLGDLLDAARFSDTGIDDKDVDTTSVCADRLDGGSDVRGFTGIGSDRNCVAPERIQGFL
jgi:hypothetical protein